ncbi:hypothetical protein K1719_003827 [Acacia pycnantha]|nr:hypothetical protein K1719_003827 [Acacia pycnantha]
MAILPRISKTCLPMASRRIESLSMQKCRVERSGLNRRAIYNQGAPTDVFKVFKTFWLVVSMINMLLDDRSVASLHSCAAALFFLFILGQI